MENKTVLYRTFFHLSRDVKDYDAAYDYLADDDMTKYLIDDRRSKSCKNKIKSIKWILSDESSGHIDLETTEELTAQQLDDISDWVSGQNSDGIGEGFEQQDFACYYDEFPDDAEDYDEYDEEDMMVEFDWKTNPYKFELVH